MRKARNLTISLVIILTVIISICLTSCKENKNDDYKKLDSERVYASTYAELAEKENLAVPALGKYPKWQEGMIGGNGITGFITSGAPYRDTLIYQHIDFLMPTTRNRDDINDITGELEGVRQAVLNKQYQETISTSWDYSYKYHPGHQLRLAQNKQIETEYKRWTDYKTGEVGVTYSDANGTWERKTFTSRVDNVTITKIEKSSTGSKINMVISIDDPSKMYSFGIDSSQLNEKDMKYKEIVSDDCSYIALVAHYPGYKNTPYENGGYVGLTYVVQKGGSKYKKVAQSENDAYSVAKEADPSIVVEDADEVYLITALDRTTQMCTFEEFKDKEDYTLVEQLANKCANVERTYQSNKTNSFDYRKALEVSAKIHNEYYSKVDIDFSQEDNNEYLTNEELLNIQSSSNKLDARMLERVYKQGRYAMICNGGYTMSRLCGMWSGDWNSTWRAIYTMDANVNLQSSGMNTSNMQFFGDGYINFILNQVDDWKINAKKIYGIDNAIQAPVNTDGDRALNNEYHISYPFQYWNAGAAWLIQPIYEYYQCYGNTEVVVRGEEKELLKDILLPLLELNANFWLGITTPKYYTNANGAACYDANKTTLNSDEKYLIIPSYSPENTTTGSYSSTLGANAAMDISAAKYSLKMVIEIEQIVNGTKNKDKIDKYTYLLNKLPNYTYDSTGAIKEWCANGYGENNNHRHISHLYLAWPAFETQEDEALKAAAVQALENRKKATSRGEGSQGHGWLHKALVAARLKDGAIVESCLYDLLSEKLQYNSFMTDHNTDRRSSVYCTDSAYGLIGIINEMLLFSNDGVIDALPALPSTLNKGEINGLRARTCASVSIKWDEEKVVVKVKSDKDQSIIVSALGKDAKPISFKADEEKEIIFKR